MKKRNKGFTLAELLIVVAIVGILVAVSIPIFSSQLEKSREATDLANMRAAKALAIAAYYDIETGNLSSDNIGGLTNLGDGSGGRFEGYYNISTGRFEGNSSKGENKSFDGKGTAVKTGNVYSNYNSEKDYTRYAIFVEIVHDKAWANRYLPTFITENRGPGILIQWRLDYSPSGAETGDYGYEWIPTE